jgi:hypothetical protein
MIVDHVFVVGANIMVKIRNVCDFSKLMKHHEMFCPLASIIEDGDENLPFRDKV